MTQTLTVRATTSADLAVVDALFARSYPALLKADYKPSVLVTALPLISRAQPRLLSSGTFYVIEDEDGTVLGAGGWSRAAPGGAREAAGFGHVRHVVTDHRSTRRGVGRALMTYVLDQARGAGLRRLACQSTLTAVPFYAACGFRALGEVAVPLRPGITFPAVAMERDLL